MDLFPVNIAVGHAFCNREQERQQLKQYVQYGRHVVLIAPRRYGKTSLVNQTLQELELPHCIIELTMATTAEDVNQLFLKHVSELLYSILPRTLKAKQKILNLFKWLNPELTLTAAGQKIIFHPGKKLANPTENIAETLKKLDEAAVLVKKKIVVFIDEFQQLCEIDHHVIEASIRHAMQYSRKTVYLFSGSNRHMISKMFNDKNRPFFNSCEMMTLNRISEKDYTAFIQKAAVKKWKKPFSSTVLELIFKLSEFHPSYINRICGYFWLTHELPTPAAIIKYWTSFVESRKTEFTQDFLRLGKNQRRLLLYLANSPTEHIAGVEVSKALEIPEASIRQAAKKLLELDLIHRDAQNLYCILDPAFRDFLRDLQGF